MRNHLWSRSRICAFPLKQSAIYPELHRAVSFRTPFSSLPAPMLISSLLSGNKSGDRCCILPWLPCRRHREDSGKVTAKCSLLFIPKDIFGKRHTSNLNFIWRRAYWTRTLYFIKLHGGETEGEGEGKRGKKRKREREQKKADVCHPPDDNVSNVINKVKQCFWSSSPRNVCTGLSLSFPFSRTTAITTDNINISLNIFLSNAIFIVLKQLRCTVQALKRLPGV